MRFFSVSGEQEKSLSLSPLSIYQSQLEGQVEDTAHLQKPLQHRNWVEGACSCCILKKSSLGKSELQFMSSSTIVCVITSSLSTQTRFVLITSTAVVNDDGWDSVWRLMTLSLLGLLEACCVFWGRVLGSACLPCADLLPAKAGGEHQLGCRGSRLSKAIF